ncbi:MAG: hypothetical protein P9X27_02055 [Candidatus Kaelpia aquatica]|nr:hypothetical protein [Candidatus Kaelpia aquatica]
MVKSNIQKIVRKIRRSMWLNNLDDLLRDFDEIDFSVHMITVPLGATWYRSINKGADPLSSTGAENRFVSQRPDYSFEKYQTAMSMGRETVAGTGATCFVSVQSVIPEEVVDFESKDCYKITLKEDIEIVDMDSICREKRISKPYMTEERHPVFQLFYGKKINGLKYESAKDPKAYCYVIYNDWFKKFRSIVTVEKILPCN